MAGASELDEPAVVDDAVHDRGGELVVREDRAPPAELHVRGEHDAPPLVRVEYDLVFRDHFRERYMPKHAMPRWSR